MKQGRGKQVEISHLEEFLVIVEEGKLGEAAERLYTTSSTLSKHIHAIEKEYGVPLFDRSKRAIILNEYGQVFLPFAQSIVNAHHEAEKKIKKKRDSHKKSLVVYAEYRIFELAVKFREKTHINLIIDENSDYNYKEFLKGGRCSLGFLVEDGQLSDDVVRIPYIRDTLILVCPADHPLAKRTSISIEELEEEEFVMFQEDNDTPINREVYRMCSEAGYTPQISFTGVTGSNIIESVKRHMGIALLWKKATEYIMVDDVATVELENSPQLEIYLCYFKDHVLSPEEQAFVEFVREEAVWE